MSSAANTSDSSEPSGDSALALSTRPNPVALEVAVNATGARPSEKKGQRDLFSEDTNTILVFSDGAVIHLCAAVVPGQLLFLTNKVTNHEVVCQVLRKRCYTPTACYVELEFTEETPDFWGVGFPQAAAAVSAATPAGSQLVETVQSAKVTADDPGPEPKMPVVDQHEVELLRTEIEELRHQLKSLVKSGGPAKPAEQSDVAASTAGSKAPTAHHSGAPVAPVIPMTLPKAVQHEANSEFDPLDDLLPKPALDFSAVGQTPIPAWAKALDTSIIPKPGQAARLRLQFSAVAGLILLGFLGAAWKLNWLRIPSLERVPSVTAQLQKSPGASATATPKPAAPTNAAPENGSAAASTPVNAADPGPGPVDPTPKPARAVRETAQPIEIRADSSDPETEAWHPAATAKRAGAPTAENETRTASGAASNNRGTGADKSATGGRGNKRSREIAPASAAPVNSEPVATDAIVIPPKLLRAASPVYPPDAMRHYITGDVKVDAVVEPNGRIGAMKILVGPTALQEAAMDALKQYEYAPATQGGKPVPAHVKVTVKFWFNP